MYVKDTPMNICGEFLHNRVTKFYVGSQPTATLILFSSLGPAADKIYDAKHRRRPSSLRVLLICFIH